MKKIFKSITKSQWIQYSIALAITILVCIFDQVTKQIALHSLQDGETKVFIPHLVGWFLARNTGAAWSILENHHWLLVVISFLAVGVVLYLMKNIEFKKQKMIYAIALSFILGGAIGNLIDRVVYYQEGVIDFIRLLFMDFPIFNVADSFLTIGTILLVVYLLFFYHPEEEEKNTSKEEKESLDSVETTSEMSSVDENLQKMEQKEEVKNNE